MSIYTKGKWNFEIKGQTLKTRSIPHMLLIEEVGELWAGEATPVVQSHYPGSIGLQNPPRGPLQIALGIYHIQGDILASPFFVLKYVNMEYNSSYY